MEPLPPTMMDLAHQNSGRALMEACSRTAAGHDREAIRARAAGQPEWADALGQLAELCRRLEGHTHMGLMRRRDPWIVRVWRAIRAA